MPLIKQIELNWTNFHLTFHNHHRCLTAAMQCCFCLPNLNTIIKCSIHLAFDFLFLFVCVCVCVLYVMFDKSRAACMCSTMSANCEESFLLLLCLTCLLILCLLCAIDAMLCYAAAAAVLVCVCVYSSGCVVGSICSHCLSNQPTDHHQAILTETVTIADRS